MLKTSRTSNVMMNASHSHRVCCSFSVNFPETGNPSLATALPIIFSALDTDMQYMYVCIYWKK